MTSNMYLTHLATGELMARISENHEGLGNRLGGLEERTREELKAVQERMKETLAEERRACQVGCNIASVCLCG